MAIERQVTVKIKTTGDASGSERVAESVRQIQAELDTVREGLSNLRPGEEGFDSLSESAFRLEQQLGATKLELDKLKDAEDRAAESSKKLQAEQEKLSSKQENLGAGIRKIRSAFLPLIAVVLSFGKGLSEANKLQKDALPATEDLSNQVDKLRGSFNQLIGTLFSPLLKGLGPTFKGLPIIIDGASESVGRLFRAIGIGSKESGSGKLIGDVKSSFKGLEETQDGLKEKSEEWADAVLDAKGAYDDAQSALDGLLQTQLALNEATKRRDIAKVKGEGLPKEQEVQRIADIEKAAAEAKFQAEEKSRRTQFEKIKSEANRLTNQKAEAKAIIDFETKHQEEIKQKAESRLALEAERDAAMEERNKQVALEESGGFLDKNLQMATAERLRQAQAGLAETGTAEAIKEQMRVSQMRKAGAEALFGGAESRLSSLNPKAALAEIARESQRAQSLRPIQAETAKIETDTQVATLRAEAAKKRAEEERKKRDALEKKPLDSEKVFGKTQEFIGDIPGAKPGTDVGIGVAQLKEALARAEKDKAATVAELAELNSLVASIGQSGLFQGDEKLTEAVKKLREQFATLAEQIKTARNEKK